MRVIGIMNRKGGVGKTTTVCNLAYWLASGHGKRVLVVDLDGQGNATDCLTGPENCRAERGVGDAAPLQGHDADTWRGVWDGVPGYADE